MVGTSATVAFLARRLSTARRSSGTVRTIRGFRDISTQSRGSGATAFQEQADRPYQHRCATAKRREEHQREVRAALCIHYEDTRLAI